MKLLKKLFFLIILLTGANNAVAQLTGYSVVSDNLYSIDIATGAETLIGPLGVTGDFEALAFDPTSGVLYVAADGNSAGASIHTVDIATGTATLVGAHGVSYTNGGMAFDSSGQGYLITSDGLFSFDKVTGVATFIGSFSSELSGGAFVGNTLYGTPDNGSTTDLVTIDTATATITSVGTLGVNVGEQSGLAYDSVSDFLYMLNETDSTIYSVNYNTGAASFVSTFTQNFESLAINGGVFSAVPQIIPTLTSVFSLSLLGFGVVLIGFINIKRRRNIIC